MDIVENNFLREWLEKAQTREQKREREEFLKAVSPTFFSYSLSFIRTETIGMKPKPIFFDKSSLKRILQGQLKVNLLLCKFRLQKCIQAPLHPCGGQGNLLEPNHVLVFQEF